MHKKWFTDKESDYRWIYHRVKKHVVSTKTKFQKVEIIDTHKLGRIVTLDNKIQSAEIDEFIYHEALVHPAMITHPNPETVLILGGGEGATLREVLKHPSVKKVVMIDIDEEFVHLCTRYLKQWHMGSFDDTRVELIFSDAKEYIKKTTYLFDIIIADISDPVEEGPAQMLYTKKFYSPVKKALMPNGIFVTHATEVYYVSDKNIFSRIFRTLSDIFPIADFYCEYIPSFSSLWGFVICSPTYSPFEMSSSQISERLKERGLGELSYYDLETHERLLRLPKCLRNHLKTRKSSKGI